LKSDRSILGRFSLPALLFLNGPVIWLKANAPGGLQQTEHPYKSHTILITCWPTLEPFGCLPEIRINNKHQIVVKSFKFTQKFKTKAEAETYSLDAAKKWIDDSTPELLQKAK
jgi:hypothetical protein